MSMIAVGVLDDRFAVGFEPYPDNPWNGDVLVIDRENSDSVVARIPETMNYGSSIGSGLPDAADIFRWCKAVEAFIDENYPTSKKEGYLGIDSLDIDSLEVVGVSTDDETIAKFQANLARNEKKVAELKEKGDSEGLAEVAFPGLYRAIVSREEDADVTISMKDFGTFIKGVVTASGKTMDIMDANPSELRAYMTVIDEATIHLLNRSGVNDPPQSILGDVSDYYSGD